MDLTEKDVATITGMMNGQPAATPAAAPAPAPTEPAPAGGDAPTAGSQPPNPGAPAAAEPAQPTAIELSKIAGGKFKSYEEIEAAIKQLDQLPTLTQQLNEAKALPKFASERHQKLYEVASKFETEEAGLDALAQQLHIARLPIDKLSAQELRMEAFRLLPENQNVSPQDLMVLFQEEENSKFGDPTVENGQTPGQKVRAEQATLNAKKALEQRKTEFLSAKTAVVDPQKEATERVAYQARVKEQLKDFAGIELNVSGTDAQTQKKVESKLNFKLDPSQQQQDRLIQAVADPQGMWINLLQEHGVMDASGKNFDTVKFGQLASKIIFQQDLVNQAYQQGRDETFAAMIKNQRNPASGADTPPPPTPSSKKSAQQEMVEGALKVIGGMGM